MARPREFDEQTVIEAAIQCFWSRGYEATSVRDLTDAMKITGASLYNAFGDKRSLYEKALCQYVDRSIGDRIARCEELAPRAAIAAFFNEVMDRSLRDPDHKGCMLVNAALDVGLDSPELSQAIVEVLVRIEGFFARCIRAGQADGSIPIAQTADDLARHLLAVLMGLRVLARVRPERDLLEGLMRPALALLTPSS